MNIVVSQVFFINIKAALVVSHFPYGPTAFFTLYNVVLRHDLAQQVTLNTVSEAYPHLIFDNFTTKLGQRVYFL